MLRLETETGWWLVTHVHHARLAAAFAENWGNEIFCPPEPREQVLMGIRSHDDGWAARDALPQITRQGKPSAFSVELVGKYSAFEEIDLEDYLKVREQAVKLIAETDSYAALLVSMHTYNLLSERADRSTIAPADLPLLDKFLAEQKLFQNGLYAAVASRPDLTSDEAAWPRIADHFRLLQAVDCLSLLTCVSYSKETDLLHALSTQNGSSSAVHVFPLNARQFRLKPYPFGVSPLVFQFPARHVTGKTFACAEELQEKASAAEPEMLSVVLTA